MTMGTIREAIAHHAIHQLNDGVGVGENSCDLHNELYNSDYFIIGTWQAKEFLGSEVFESIAIIREYEMDNFGEVSTDIGDPEKVVNMLSYIVGEEILQESKTLQELCDEELTAANVASIAEELKNNI